MGSKNTTIQCRFNKQHLGGLLPHVFTEQAVAQLDENGNGQQVVAQIEDDGYVLQTY